MKICTIKLCNTLKAFPQILRTKKGYPTSPILLNVALDVLVSTLICRQKCMSIGK